MRNLRSKKVIRSGILTWVTALAALLYLFSSSLYAATTLDEVAFSPDVTVVIGGETANDEDVAADDLAGTITPIDVGSIPTATDVNAYHELPDRDRLISFDTTVDLGGLTVGPGDVVRYDGSTYFLEFDASANGVPSGVLTDAISVDTSGDLLLSFDTTVALSDALTVDDEDVVVFDGADFSLFFDGSVAGIAPSLDLDGVHYLSSDRLLLSLDGSGTVGGVSFDDEDVLEHDFSGGTWHLSYDGSSQHAAWSPADLDALHALQAEVQCARVEDLAARSKSAKVQLTWTHVGDDSYNVYRRTDQGGPFALLASTTSTYSTYLDTTVTNGTTYYYVVNGVCGVTEGEASNEASATPQARRRR